MHIKDKIRAFAVICRDMFIREPKFIVKYFSFGKLQEGKTGFVFCVDGKQHHGGLFDQFKGMISVYASAKVYGIPFYVNYTYLIKLEEYLQPNNYDWRISNYEINNIFPFAKPVIAFGEYVYPYRLMKTYKGHQIHFYLGIDIIDKINKKFHTNYEWGDLYRELFKPSEKLSDYILEIKEQIGNKYVAVHIRFANLLGENVERFDAPVLCELEQAKLISNLRKKISEINKQNQTSKILITTDSNVFINYIKKVPYVFIIPGKAKHVDNSSLMNDDDNLKLFLDYYMIAGATHVYSIVGNGLYPSAFPEYSAKIGKCKFTRISL